MNRLAWVVPSLLGLVFAAGSVSVPDPRPALSEIARIEAEAPGASPAEVEARRARILEIAKKAVDGIDAASVPSDRAHLWGHLFVFADQKESAVVAYERFLAVDREPSAKLDVQFALVGLYASLGRGGPLRRTLLAMEPATNLEKALLASIAAVHADLIADAAGEAEAIATLEAMDARVAWAAFGSPSDATVPAEQRQTAEGYRVTLILAMADLLVRTGNRDAAIAQLDRGLLALPENSPSRRQLQTRRTQLSLIGARAPELDVERTHGRFGGLRSMRGQVVVVVFFAHWCGPCLQALRELKVLSEELGPQGVQFVAATTFYGYFRQENATNRDMPKDVEFARVGTLVADLQAPWPTVFGPRSNFTAYAVSGIPHFAAIDREGVVRHIQIGFSGRSSARLRRAVEALARADN
ncbi:MAG: TlpA disulfide reductase family protein [Fimbriimonadaceae bacterium]